jgi:23S rRNA pseudouridine1911/1915/1917 synthase
VHRLDKNTAGLLLVAKDTVTQGKLSQMFEKHKVKRTYIGVCCGKIESDITINKNIIRSPKHRTLFTTAAVGGRTAITHLKVLKQYNKYTVCEFNLETGRTHQIRVHCKSIGNPLFGDPEYNPAGGSGQMLDAIKLELIHPITHKLLQAEISPTEELKKLYT